MKKQRYTESLEKWESENVKKDTWHGGSQGNERDSSDWVFNVDGTTYVTGYVSYESRDDTHSRYGYHEARIPSHNSFGCFRGRG